MSMTRKDFIVIANIIASVSDGPARADLALHFAGSLAKSNPRFNRDRFVSHACMASNGDGEPAQRTLVTKGGR